MPPQSHLSEYTVEIVCCLNVVCQSVTTNFKLFLILFHLLHVYLYWCFAFLLRVYLYRGLGLRPPTIYNIMRTVKLLSGSSLPYHGFSVCMDLYS